MGQGLRFLQEHFLVACSLADLVRRFKRTNQDWNALPNKVAIQMNDTHPALAVPELTRLLLDEAHLGWDEAWSLTERSLAFTNHTLLPEALEKWPLRYFQNVIPRNLEIIYEINRRFSMRARALPRRRGSCRAHEPHRGGARTAKCEWRISPSSALTARTALPPFTQSCCARGWQRFRRDVPLSASTTRPTVSTPRRWLLLANPWLSAAAA